MHYTVGLTSWAGRVFQFGSLAWLYVKSRKGIGLSNGTLDVELKDRKEVIKAQTPVILFTLTWFNNRPFYQR